MKKKEISTSKKYLNEHEADILKNLQRGKFNIITSPTGSGKTYFIKKYCEKNTKGVNIFLAPMTVIVDQFKEELRQKDFKLKEARVNELAQWGFHETYEWDEENLAIKTEDGEGVVAVSTFAGFVKNIDKIDFSCVDTIFIDEIHMLSTMAPYANETIGPLWNLIIDRGTDDFKCTIVGLTAEKEYIEKFKAFWKCDTLIDVNIEWHLKPNEVVLIESERSKWQQKIGEYISTNVNTEEDESVLIIAERTSQVRRLLKDNGIPEVKKGSIAREKTDCEVYRYVCTHSAFPKQIRVYVATTFMSTGANINNDNFKHVICLFPDLLIAKQAMSRARAGNVNLVVFRDSTKNQAYQEIDKSKIDRHLKVLRELRLSSEGIYQAGRARKISELTGMADVHAEYQRRIFASREQIKKSCKELFKVDLVLFEDIKKQKDCLDEVVRIGRKERKNLCERLECKPQSLKSKIAEKFPSSSLIDSNTTSWFYKFTNEEDSINFKRAAEYVKVV